MGYKYIDKNTWKRKKQYDLFSTFGNPCYTVGGRIDVTRIVTYAKEKKCSFFDCFVYVLTKVCNEFEGFRLRMDSDKNVILYDRVDPSFTVFLADENYDTCTTGMENDFESFQVKIRGAIKDLKKGKYISTKLNENMRTDLLYYSCMPWIDAQVYQQPLPLDNPASLSIPRINWGKYVWENGGYKMFISFTVSHALMDGYELSQSMLRLEEKCRILNYLE